MIDPHPCYHHAITGKEAEKKMKNSGDHCYLTRYSEIKKCYVLSVYQKKPNRVMKHFEISVTEFEGQKQYKIDGKTRVFNGIKELLTYYENNSIDPALKNIGVGIEEEQYRTARRCIIQ